MKENIKNFFKVLGNWIKNKIWYTVLLGASSIYVFYYRQEIYELKELNVRNLIFLLWLVLLLLPLFSEMEFLGIKIKKEVENANRGVKEEVKQVEKQITELKLNNAIANSVQISNNFLPSEEKLKELARSILKEEGKAPKQDRDEMPKDKSVYLLKVRQSIEALVGEILNRVEYAGRTSSLGTNIVQLHNLGIYDRNTMEVLLEIVRIANRGIHNEILSDEYIEFVQAMYPQMIKQLTSCLKSI